MPGLYGIGCDGPRFDLPERLRGMAETLRHHPSYTADGYVDPEGRLALGRTSLGIVDQAEQPASNEDGSYLAVLAGEVLDYAEHRRTLAAAGHVFRSDSHAELLLHGFESGGQAFFRSLCGSFAAALWDVGRRRLILANDRFGMKPLYYARVPGELLFGSEIKALLTDPRVSRRQSIRGIASFFTFGQLLGEDTLLEGIHLLPAAGWLTYDAAPGRVTLERYWQLQAVPDRRSYAAHLERIDAAFKRAVDRCTVGPGRLGLSLSGGLDSRTILAAAEPDRELASVSLGIEGSLDHQCAERMSALSGHPYHRFLLDENFLAHFEAHLEHMVRLTDGHYLCQCIVMPTLPAYRELGVEILLRGHAGELMHMGKAYNFSVDRAALSLRDGAALETWLMQRLRAHISDPARGSLFRRGIDDQVEDLARAALRDALSESEGIEPPAHRIWHLFLTQRLRRETALSMVEFNSVVETRLPYLDNDLVDALMAAPPDFKLGDRIQTEILRRRMPSFLNVVNANTGARLGAGGLERGVATARKKILAKLGVRGYQPYERLGLWLRRELRPTVERLLLGDECLDQGLFAPEAVRGVVNDHLSGRWNHTYLLLVLLIFETGRRVLDERMSPA